MSGLDALLAGLPRWTLVGGKGGVGKTTCAAALALRSAAAGRPTLLLSTDPARTLGDAIGADLTDRPRRVLDAQPLDAAQLDAEAARNAFLDRWRSVLVAIVDRGTYLDREDVEGLIESTLPGVDEAMAFLELASLEREDGRRWERIVVDTAPTGHTLRLLRLPDTFRALVDLLELMQAKHRFMVQALTHRYRLDDADAFLDEMRDRISALGETLRDPQRAAMVLVTRPEPMVVAETGRFAAALRELGIAIGGVVMNAVPERPTGEERNAFRGLVGIGREITVEVPELAAPPIGIGGIESWSRAARAARGPPPENHDGSKPRQERHPPAPHDIDSAAAEHQQHRGDDQRPAARALTIVGGKGGVGKTTAACAIALEAARVDRPVLLVSTDPAPSIADALDQPVPDEETPIADAEGLVARQMDADAAFAELRREYEARIDALFDRVLGKNVDAVHDRRILRQLMAMAPPGIDELYALSLLGETLGTGHFAHVIVDPAPTGHLLRLLEMPALALDWTHRLLRLMLKYKDIGTLGDASEALLAFARRTRSVDEMLHDAGRSGLLIVALDEPLVRAETARLVGEIRRRGIDVIGILWNRADGAASPLPAAPPVRQFVAPDADPPPRGVAPIRGWYRQWHSIPSTNG